MDSSVFGFFKGSQDLLKNNISNEINDFTCAALQNIATSKNFNKLYIQSLFDIKFGEDLESYNMLQLYPLIWANNYSEVIDMMTLTDRSPEAQDVALLYVYAAREIIKRPKEALNIFYEVQSLAQTRLVKTNLNNLIEGYLPKTYYSSPYEIFYLLMAAMIHTKDYFKANWENILNWLYKQLDAAEKLDPYGYEFAPHDVVIPLAASLVFPQIGISSQDKKAIDNLCLGLRFLIPHLKQVLNSIESQSKQVSRTI